MGPGRASRPDTGGGGVIIPRKRKRQRMRKLNPDRPASPGHLRWVRARESAVMKEGECVGPVEAHHVRARGAGGGDEAVVPLCVQHHQEVHALGRDTFAKRYDVDLAEVAAALWRIDTYHRVRWEKARQEGI